MRIKTVETKRKILSVCVRLFIEQGYYSTTINQITKEAEISLSTFQNIFQTKDAVLFELVQFMFHGQFKAARYYVHEELSPMYIYAVETAIQLALTEANDNIRQIYIEAYQHDKSLEYIHQQLAVELYKTFGHNFPSSTAKDFYSIDIGTSSILRAYMVQRCNIHFTFDQKIEHFLSLTLRAYKVPENDIQKVVAYIRSLDIYDMADSVIQNLFDELKVEFDFKIKKTII